DPGYRAAAAASPLAGHEVVRVSRRDVDVTDVRAVRRAVEAHRPDAIVNCTAYTDVDGAETDAMTALAVNALAVRGLADVASESGAALVHYGTDFVFDG